jgi:hypothetical protein
MLIILKLIEKSGADKLICKASGRNDYWKSIKEIKTADNGRTLIILEVNFHR